MVLKANEDKTLFERVDSIRIDKVELEFKASLHHQIWMERASKQGLHNKLSHLNAFEVAPPLRHDQRYCDKCSFSMVPYENLPEAVKELDRDIVRSHRIVQEVWEARKR